MLVCSSLSKCLTGDLDAVKQRDVEKEAKPGAYNPCDQKYKSRTVLQYKGKVWPLETPRSPTKALTSKAGRLSTEASLSRVLRINAHFWEIHMLVLNLKLYE